VRQFLSKKADVIAAGILQTLVSNKMPRIFANGLSSKKLLPIKQEHNAILAAMMKLIPVVHLKQDRAAHNFRPFLWPICGE
jgi:hypothetical protein